MATMSGCIGRPVVVGIGLVLGCALAVEHPLRAGSAVALYDNGGLATGALAENGAFAPAGAQWSEAPNPFGSTQSANSSAGTSCSVTTTTTFRCADDFNVPVGEAWTLTHVVIFAYQTGFAGVTSP